MKYWSIVLHITCQRKVFCMWAQKVYKLLVWAPKLGSRAQKQLLYHKLMRRRHCGCWPDVITGQELPRTSFLASMNKLWPERFVWLAAGRSQALVVWQWIWHSGIIWWFWEAQTTVISHLPQREMTECCKSVMSLDFCNDLINKPSG